MKNILEKWNSINLIWRIGAGVVIGALLGVIIPDVTVIAVFGKLFVGALKAIAPLLVFTLVMSSLANANTGIDKKFRTVIIMYMITTILAAVAAVAASFLFPVTLKLTAPAEAAAAPEGIGEVLLSVLENVVANPVKSLSEANYLGILAWSVMFGTAFKSFAAEGTKAVLSDAALAVSNVVQKVISLAPFGILGLVYDAVSKNGLEMFADYGRLLLVLVGTMLAVALIINPAIAAAFMHKNPYPLVFQCLKESGITAFFTRSSAANIPVNMALCEKLGLDENFYSVALPLGATVNMDGAAVTITVMSLAAANTLNIAVDIPTAIILCLLAAVSACGASGVAGGSLLLIPMACSLFGISSDISMQVVAVGFIIGVVQDSFETAINSSGDVLFAAAAEYYDRLKRKK